MGGGTWRKLELVLALKKSAQGRPGGHASPSLLRDREGHRCLAESPGLRGCGAAPGEP